MSAKAIPPTADAFDEMKTDLSFADFLSAWLGAGKPEYLSADYSDKENGKYLGAPVYCSNHARISKDGLPADILARFPKEETARAHCEAIVGPAWTRAHGPVLDVSFSAYCNGWSLFAVGTYLPLEGRWVHPSEVHTYSTPQS